MPTGVTKLSLTELNPHLTCVLCSGYLIDAVTIVECLHSFCRACLLQYLETSETCPICDCVVNKIQLHKSIRSDQTLQDLTYKLVPGLYKSELRRRKDFYVNYFKRLGDNPCGSGSARNKSSSVQIFDRHLVELSALIYTPDELISLSLEYAPPTRAPEQKSATDHLRSGAKRRKLSKLNDTVEGNSDRIDDLSFRKKYFRCPAAITINHLKKLLRYKLELSPDYHVEILHSDEPLEGSFTLMDVAYIYTWRRKAPMQLFFHVCKFEAVEEDTAASLATMPQLVKEVLVADENSAVPSRSDRPESPDTECLSVLKSKIRTSKNAAALEGLQKISESTTVTSVGPNSTCDPVSNAVSQPVTVSLVGTQISAPKRVGAQKRKPPKLSPTRVEKVPTDPDTKEGLKKPTGEGSGVVAGGKKTDCDEAQNLNYGGLQKVPTSFSVANLCS